MMRRWSAPLLLLGLIGLVYQPWAARPLDLLDFSEFLPLLGSADGLGDRMLALWRYYAEHGRSVWVTYAYIAINGSLFGRSAAGWEAARLLLMSLNVWLLYAVLRRAGIGALAAAVGACVFITGTAASGAWLRLTGEMLSVTCLLAALWLALGYRQHPSPRLAAAGIGLLVLLAAFSKETSAVMGLPLLLMALLWPSEDDAPPPWRDPRTMPLFVACALAIGVAVASIVAVRANMPTDAYAQSYGHGDVTWARAVAFTRFFVQPFALGGLELRILLDVLVAALVLGGWALLLQDSSTRRRAVVGGVAALLAILTGIVVYLPWPRLESFYMYPHALGPAVLLAAGVHGLQRGSRLLRAAGAVGGLLLVALTIIPAANLSAGDRAYKELQWGVVRMLPQAPLGDTLVVAVQDLPPQPWQGQGATLRRFALAVGVADTLPPMRDELCATVAQRLADPSWRVTLLSYHNRCGALPGATWFLTSPYERRDPLTGRAAPVALRVDFRLSSAARAPRSAAP